MLSDPSNQVEAAVEPIESVGVELVAPIPDSRIRRRIGHASETGHLADWLCCQLR